MRAHIAEIGRVADTLVCAYPNAGLPNEFGRYDESPEYMGELLGEFADSGLVTVLVDGKRRGDVRVDGPRLYTAVSQRGVSDGKLELHFTPGISAYSFTFG